MLNSQKKDACATKGEPFKNHTVLCKELVDWVVAQGIPDDFTFDNYFTNADVLLTGNLTNGSACSMLILE
jgi:hypothetical protein